MSSGIETTKIPNLHFYEVLDSSDRSHLKEELNKWRETAKKVCFERLGKTWDDIDLILEEASLDPIGLRLSSSVYILNRIELELEEEASHIFLCVDEAKKIHSIASAYFMNHSLCLDYLATNPDNIIFEKKGAGAAMIEGLKEFAINHIKSPTPSIVLETTSTAIGFYQKMGFTSSSESCWDEMNLTLSKKTVCASS